VKQIDQIKWYKYKYYSTLYSLRMDLLYNELRIEIFKFVSKPISLIIADRKWYAISQDPHARTEWLIYKYGKAHALFYAVRLGRTFITKDVVVDLLARHAVMSRYFIQRLLMHFGAYDEKLIELKIEHNVNQIDFDRINAFQRKLQSPWASNLPLPIFTKLITEGYKILNDNDLATKGNDMELFHFLSAGPLVINHAPQKLKQNINEIKDLILNKKFIPFPPRPKPVYEDTTEYIQLMHARAHEEYPPKDGFENSRQLNVVARAILIQPDLVNLWKEIGYHEVCRDINELVMQGALLILFLSNPPSNWECPSVNVVITRLKPLVDLGFQLTDIVMEEAFHSFESRLNEIGDILMNSFHMIHNKSISAIARSCLIQAIKPERSHKKTDLLEFLIDKIEDPEEALMDALENYKIGFKFNDNSIKNVKIRSLSVHSNFYYWMIRKYGINSENTQKCFEDILESRIWIDLKLQENPDRPVPENLTTAAFNSICSIYLEYCNRRIPFKTNYLSYLKLANNEEIIRSLFEIGLPIVFGLPLKCNLPIPYEVIRPDVPYEDTEEINNDQLNRNEIGEWTELLDKIFFDGSENFKHNLNEFRGRITSQN
jgi:hypothetical protein